MKDSAFLEITSCKQCPHFTNTHCQTDDSFESPEDWWCNETGTLRKIQGYVEWHEERHIKIPKWCPLKGH